MTDLLGIIARNNATFYDYRSGSRTSVYPRLFCFLVLSIIASILFRASTEAFISSVITVQSILVGFGFSVLFFLVSSGKEKSSEEDSLEVKNRIKRLNTLSDELFYNVSYYNMATILSVILALIMSMPDVGNLNLIQSNQTIQGWLSDWRVESIILFATYAFLSAFYFSVLESLFTFYRIVVRVNFYFSQKLKLRE